MSGKGGKVLAGFVVRPLTDEGALMTNNLPALPEEVTPFAMAA